MSTAEVIGEGFGRKMIPNPPSDGHRISSYPFTHQAVVEGQADELEGRLLDEVGVEDPYLRGFPGYVVRHRLPKPFRALLRYLEPRQREKRNGRSGTLLAGFIIKKTFLGGDTRDLGMASSFILH